MTLPTPDQIRSRQTAYLATEAWWKTRVEKLAEKYEKRQAACFPEYEGSAAGDAARDLRALLAERPSR